jgi:hypothetical protein
MSRGTYSNNGIEVVPARAIPSRLPDIIGLGGTIAGLGGGLAMIVVAALLTAAGGGDVWREPREIAQPLFGVVSSNDWAPVLVGTILHFLIAGLLGAVFGIVSRRMLHLPSDYGVPVLAGLIYGMALWALAFFVVLPILNPALLDTYAPSFIIQHLIYGVVTGLLYAQLRPAPYAHSMFERTAPLMGD